MLYSENVIYFERLLTTRTFAVRYRLSLGQSWGFMKRIGFAIPHCEPWNAKGGCRRQDKDRKIVHRALMRLSQVYIWLRHNAKILEVTNVCFSDACRDNLSVDLFNGIVKYLEYVPGWKVFITPGHNPSKRTAINMLTVSRHWRISDITLAQCCCPVWLFANYISDYLSEYLKKYPRENFH